MIYKVLDTGFELKETLPLEDAFMAAVDGVNHYMVEDKAAGELYAHPLLRQAWAAKLFLQYYTDLDLRQFEREGRNAIYVLLQWVQDNEVLDLDDVMRKCYARFYGMMLEAEHTMLLRYEQRVSAGNQLRKLLGFIQLRDENGEGGWDALREVISGYMLDKRPEERGKAPDIRMFQKMKPPATEE